VRRRPLAVFGGCRFGAGILGHVCRDRRAAGGIDGCGAWRSRICRTLRPARRRRLGDSCASENACAFRRGFAGGSGFAGRIRFVCVRSRRAGCTAEHWRGSRAPRPSALRRAVLQKRHRRSRSLPCAAVTSCGGLGGFRNSDCSGQTFDQWQWRSGHQKQALALRPRWTLQPARAAQAFRRALGAGAVAGDTMSEPFSTSRATRSSSSMRAKRSSRSARSTLGAGPLFACERPAAGAFIRAEVSAKARSTNSTASARHGREVRMKDCVPAKPLMFAKKPCANGPFARLTRASFGW